MKKSLKALLVMLLVVTGVLTGCGSDESADGKTEIKFMHSSIEPDRQKVINELVAEFEKENPDITVKQVPVSEDNYNTKIVTLANSGELPAVIEIGQDYAKVMDKDQLIDRDAVTEIVKEIGEDTYYSGAIKLFKTEDGKQYTGAPITGWVQGIWYNEEMLASKGFSEPQTWEEIMAIAEAFNDPANKKYGIAMPTAESGFSEQAFSQFALSNGANVFKEDGSVDVDSPKMKEALEYYTGLAKYTMPGSNDTTEVNDAFKAGQVPMAIYSTYILPGLFEAGHADNVGFTVPNKESKAAFGNVTGLTITAGLSDEELEASKKFVKFMSEPENMTKWVLMSPGGAQPVSDAVTTSEAYQSNEVVKAFGDLSTEIANSFNDIQVFGLVGDKNFSEMGAVTASAAIPKMINAVTVGGEDLEEQLKLADEAVKEALKE